MERTPGTNSPVGGTSDGHCNVVIEPEFFSLEDVAGILRLSIREVYRLADDGELDIVPYKRRKLVEPASVKRLAAKIRAGEFAPTALAIAA